jgi:hypothetical protein
LSDYIPARDAEFDRFFKFISQYVETKCSGSKPEWNHIPQAARTALSGAYASWSAAFGSTRVPHTPQTTEEKNRTRRAAEQYLRPFVNQYLRFPPVTDNDRDNMGIPNRDTIPSPVPPPSAQAEADITFPGVHLVELSRIRAVGSGASDIRRGSGVRIHFGLRGTPSEIYKYRLSGEPQSGTELPYSVFTRRKKERFDFDGESGNTVYFCLRYENAKGQTGPFGPLLSAVIP